MANKRGNGRSARDQCGWERGCGSGEAEKHGHQALGWEDSQTLKYTPNLDPPEVAFKTRRRPFWGQTDVSKPIKTTTLHDLCST